MLWRFWPTFACIHCPDLWIWSFSFFIFVFCSIVGKTYGRAYHLSCSRYWNYIFLLFLMQSTYGSKSSPICPRGYECDNWNWAKSIFFFLGAQCVFWALHSSFKTMFFAQCFLGFNYCFQDNVLCLVFLGFNCWSWKKICLCTVYFHTFNGPPILFMVVMLTFSMICVWLAFLQESFTLFVHDLYPSKEF